MFSQNDLINNLQAKVDSFIQVLDFNIPEKKPNLPVPHRNIIPPYIAKAMLEHYKRTQDELQKEYDEILELRKQITDNDNPELSTLDCKISGLEKKIELAIEHLELQKRSNQKQAEIREERQRLSLEKIMGEQSIQKIGQFFSSNYNIDVTLCDVFEESILKLAGVEEKPTACTYTYSSPLPHSSLQPKHTMANSIFFSLGLSQPESMQKLIQYASENKLDPFDYSDRLPKDSNKYLIRMNSQQLLNIALPQIQTYLNDNVSEIIRYKQIMDKQTRPFLFFTPATRSDRIYDADVQMKNNK